MDLTQACYLMADKLIALRRDFHRYPEPGWLEFRTSAIVASALAHHGYKVLLGDEAVNRKRTMGFPCADEIDSAVRRAILEGASPDVVGMMRGLTGVVGVLDTGRPGPSVALRFDMDALELEESDDHCHAPHREGFASLHPGVMHACGHDGHTAIGLCLAEVLMGIKADLKGIVKLIFQPAEEGVRGARAMVEAGVVDNVDHMFASHLFPSQSDDLGVVARSRGFLATAKMRVLFTGKAAHAGISPETGRNALLAAANAALNLHAIAPHSGGPTRLNVGFLHAGSSINIVPDHALLGFETRGATTDLNDYVMARASEVIRAGAEMYGVQHETKELGRACSGEGDIELGESLASVARRLGVRDVRPEADFGGSDDATFFMERVQQGGGKAAYYQVLTPMAAGLHTCRFDFDERALPLAVALAAHTVLEISARR